MYPLISWAIFACGSSRAQLSMMEEEKPTEENRKPRLLGK